MKALAIAATTALRPDNGHWRVPSQSGNGTYAVDVMSDGSWRCGCPDFEERLAPCKHILSVEYTLRREGGGQTMPFSDVVKVTYSRDWASYNAAQVNEKAMFVSLLADLCSGITQPEAAATGRPRLPLSDVVFAHIYRCYVKCSARRFGSDLADAAEKGIIDAVPAFNSVLRYGKSEELTPILTALVEASSAPLASVETDFAADSTGFGTARLRTWFSTKHGRELTVRDWVKLHAMIGVRTHIITAAVITQANANDAPYLPELAKTTAKTFTMNEISADKGYASRSNADAIEALGAVPFIPFKCNAVQPAPGSAWARMYHYFNYKRDEFLTHYHK